MEYHFKNIRILQNEKPTAFACAASYPRFDESVAADTIRFHKTIPAYGITNLV